MKTLIILSTLFIAALAAPNHQVLPSANDIRVAFQESKIIPDVLAYPTSSPAEMLSLKYGNRGVSLGTIFTETEVQNEPIVGWTADSKSFYTLAMG